VLRELYPIEVEEGAPLHRCECDAVEWWRRFEGELRQPLRGVAPYASRGVHKAPQQPTRTAIRGEGRSATASIAELVSSGAGVLAVCADASRRAALAGGATGLARFNGGAALTACHRCGRESVAGLAARSEGGLALLDYGALLSEPDLAKEFEHVVLVDPPPGPIAAGNASRPRGGPERSASPLEQPVHPGYLHEVWTESERRFALAVLESQAPSRRTVAAAFRALREAGSSSGEPLRNALAGGGAHPLGPEAAARCFRVLAELGLVRGEPNGGDGAVGVVSSEGTKLERSAAFRAYSEELLEARLYLERRTLP
jgi:hypothetical protein